MNKVDYPIDKRKWHPSLIPGVVVLVSTYDENGTPHFAPKSWVQMVSFEPPILMFSGSKDNLTERNILKTECFALNFVDSTVSGKVFESVNWQGAERVEKTGFEMVKASTINAPLVADCRAHLECTLHSTKEVGSGFVVFGNIVSASIWDQILSVEDDKKYELLDLIVFLEDGVFSRIDKA